MYETLIWILVTLYIHTGYTLSCTDFFLLLDWCSCPVEQSPSFHFSCPGSVSSYTGHVPSSYMECPELCKLSLPLLPLLLLIFLCLLPLFYSLLLLRIFFLLLLFLYSVHLMHCILYRKYCIVPCTLYNVYQVLYTVCRMMFIQYIV